MGKVNSDSSVPSTVQRCPFQGSRSAEPLASDTLTYNDYLKIPELLTIQQPLSDHHDELLFIIIHQAYELWFKQILHELEGARSFMQALQPARAAHLIHRSAKIMNHLVAQIHLLETMAPHHFLAFRDSLRPASGFQSFQFREVEFLMGLKDPSFMDYFENRPDLGRRLKRRLEEPDLQSSYYEMLRSLGYAVPEFSEGGLSEEVRIKALSALKSIYHESVEHQPIYLLTEALIDFDEALGFWREHHVRVVERMIGSKIGTGGSEGVGYLRSTVEKKCFPLLWEVRSHLGGHA